MAEAAAFAKRPLVISHTGARDADRPSAQHRRCDDQRGRRQGRRGRRLFHAVPDAPTANRRARTCIAHIEHVANVAGEDHVGIGTDNGVLPIVIDAEGDRGESQMGGGADQGRASPRRARGSTSSRSSPTITASTATGGSPTTSPSAAGARRGWRNCSAAISCASIARRGAARRRRLSLDVRRRRSRRQSCLRSSHTENAGAKG